MRWNETNQKRYRAELKYICSEALLTEIEQRLKPLMQGDVHGDADNIYSVYSMYFDDHKDSCWFDNDIGTNIRHKYRVRYYNDNSQQLWLERKEKRNGLCCKAKCPITVEQFQMLCSRYGMEAFWDSGEEVLRCFCTEKAQCLYMPRIIVSYERSAYTLYGGNIRITFDRNIAASDELDRFLEGDFRLRPVHPTGIHLLEIKYDDCLPDYLKAALPAEGLIQIAFSKYNISRKAIALPRRIL